MLASELFGKLWRWEDIEIKGISDNSQKIKQGYVFICLKGSENDGCSFVEEALNNGAVAIVSYRFIELDVPLVEVADTNATMAYLAKKFYFSKETAFKLIGVTGTNGKTTVTHIINDILQTCGKKVGLIGTNGIFIQGERKNIDTDTPTTPKSLELWKIFGIMADEGVEYIVMEVSSHALSLKRVLGCEFDVSVFTNLTRDHLDFHENMNEYRKAKEKLFEISKAGVINIDDPNGACIYAGLKKEKMAVGFADTPLSIYGLSMTEHGSVFGMEYNGIREKVNLKLPGKFNVYNSLCAVGACMLAGVDFIEAVRGLNSAGEVKGRMESVHVDGEFAVFIDYAHTPDGLEKIIHTAKGFSKGKVITLFGCGGDRDKTKRAIMGEIAGKFSDYTIITSDNPRTENPFSIIGDIFEGINRTKGKYCIVPDRRNAIYHAFSIAKKGDVVLIAGKGQEDYQIIGKNKIHFDEREIIKEYFENKN